MTTINSLQEAMLNRGKIFQKKEILDLIEKYKKINPELKQKNIIEYLSKNRYLTRIFLGYYYVNSYDERERKFCNYSQKELIFMVLNKENIKWYLGLNTAIYQQGKTWQTPVIINIINTRLSGEKIILGLKIRFKKIKQELYFGIKQAKTQKDVPFFYSDPAKTYIDMVYFKQAKELTRVKNTKEYLKRYPKWLGKK